MPNLNALLRAKSVAVIGASTKPDSFGWYVIRQLIDFGYQGAILPVNPRYSEIDGRTCFPDLESITIPVDCAAICVADERLEHALQSVIDKGVPAAVIFGSAAGFANDGSKLTDRLRSMARDADLALIGANCMGLFNFPDRLFLTGYPYHREPVSGTISFITHSGSTFSAVAKNTRSLNFNYVISPGQELALTASDYLRFVVELPETRVVGLFLETIRDPDGFRAALDVASDRDVPVVLLKVGRTSAGARMALAHTGALAGEQAVIEAVASRHNVVLVRTMEEMIDTLELFNTARRPTTNGLAAITDSGGERGLMVDLATDIGIDFAQLSSETTEILAGILDPGLEPGNPADLWGSGRDWQQVYRTSIDAMAADEAVGAFNFGIDFNVGSRLGPDYRTIAIEAYKSTTKPFAVVTNVTDGINPVDATALRTAGVPVLMGTETGLLAFKHLFDFQQHREEGAATGKPQSGPNNIPDTFLHDLSIGRPLTESESIAVLERFGFRGVRQYSVFDKSSAVAAAAEFGFPVVLKTAEPGVLHKSELGGVHLNIQSVEATATSYDALAHRFGPRVLVQEMIDTSAGVELFLGMSIDAQFGALVTLGLGGIWIETLKDSVSFLAPCSASEIKRRMATLRGYGLLQGARGKQPVDIGALAALIQRFSECCFDLTRLVAEIDINPLFACDDRFTMLDALVIPAGASRSDAHTD